jgi:ubiquitin-conjugating enzyme E2 D/E
MATLSRNSSMNSIRRLSTELTEISRGKNEFEIRISDENMSVWEAILRGPVGSPYEGFSFTVDLIFPATYPFEPPKATFRTPIFHPNISNTGAICLDILKAKGSWSPLMTVESLLVSIQSLLDDPNPSDPLNIEAAELFLRNKRSYDRQAREEATKRAAQGSCSRREDPFAFLQENRRGGVVDEDDAVQIAMRNSRVIK